MLDNLYRRRLEKELDGWAARGWVSAEGAANIRASLGTATIASRLPAMLGFLGAVLLAFAAMTFVAANWEEIPRLARFALLLAAMALAYGLAAGFTRRGHPLYGDAAVMLGAGVFGAAIMLVAQIYHIQSNFADGVLLWMLGALAAALLGGSRGAAAIAFGGLVYWSGLEILQGPWRLHWPFLPLWALAVVAVEQRDWQAGRHLAVLSLFIWIWLMIAKLFDASGWPLYAVSLIAVPLMTFAWASAHLLMLPRMPARLAAYGMVLRPYAIFAILAALFALQEWTGLSRAAAKSGQGGWLAAGLLLIAASIAGAVFARLRGGLANADVAAVAIIVVAPWLFSFIFPPASTGDLSLAHEIALALLMLYAAIWTVGYGQARAHQTSVTLGLIAFGGEVIYLYFETFGTLLDTALFFLVGGILLIVLAFGLTRMHKRLAHRTKAEAAS